MLVTLSEFALLKQVTPAAVTAACKKRIKDAIVERHGKRMLDREKALALWDRNTRRNGSEKVSEDAKRRDRRIVDVARPADEPEVRDELKSYIMGLPEDQIPGLDISRERKEHYQAELAKLEALSKREELVPAQVVKKEAFALGRSIRDNVMGIPDRVAPQLAAVQDSRDVHRILTEELRTALRVLANG